jgi:hypothetical protein
MASASAPIARRRTASRATAPRSTFSRIVPSARVRSGTSARKSRGIAGTNSPHRPQVWRRSRRRISSTSRKPAVMMIPVFAPLRSSSALVPTVVPWTTAASLAKSGWPCAMPSTKPTDWSPLVEGTLRVLASPVASSKKNRSVNVPPTSTPTTVVALMPHRPSSRSPGADRVRSLRTNALGDRRTRRRRASPGAGARPS